MREPTHKPQPYPSDVSFFETIKMRATSAWRGTLPSNPSDISLFDTVETNTVSISRRIRRLDLIDILFILLPCFSIGLWAISLQHVSVNDMNDLGLISALSPRIIAALGILVVSFVCVLQRRELRPLLLALHIIFIILIIDGTQNLVEEMPRFTIVYRHEGFTEYIMRTDTINTKLDAYFSWPIFFVLSAFVTKVFGYSTILSYAGWAPVFYSLIYFGPLYMIFTSITKNNRIVWLSILFFYLTNWVGEEYFSPQGLNFFLYMVIIAMFLKWFRMPPKLQKQWSSKQLNWQNESFRQKFAEWIKTPDPIATTLQPWQQRGMLLCLLLIFGLVVSSHQLTPVSILVSIGALVLFRRCRPFWLFILLAIMTIAWDVFVAGPYLSAHSGMLTGSLGTFFANLSTTTTQRAAVGDPQHQFVARLRLVASALIWFLAFIGCIRRLRQGHRDITYILLAVSIFPLIVVQNYGGEMFLRIYLFTLPFMVFFAAALFYSQPLQVKRITSLSLSRSQFRFSWMTAAVMMMSLILLGSFFFTRYGNEHVDYITYNEWQGVEYLYQIAPAHSLLLEPTNSTPWRFAKDEQYICETLTDTSSLVPAVLDANANPIIQFIEKSRMPSVYIIFTRGQQAQFTAYQGAPGNALPKLEAALLKSGKFQQVYHNPDAQILLFTGSS